MANFPDSVTSFATRSAGQTINAAHVNDLQDEVNAIEGGYLNGTARLNSSASTLASLDVNGNSTFASSMTFGSIPYIMPSSGGSTGTVLTCVSTSGSTMTLEWRSGGGGGKPLAVWNAIANQPPASAYATPDVRNSHPVLDFDGSSDEEAVFGGVLSTSYAAGGLTCKTWWAMSTATSGSFRVQAGIERVLAGTLDIDADSFASFQSGGGTANGTCGVTSTVSVAFTDGAQMDSLAAGEAFRLKIRRDADGTSGTDDITSDAELLRVVLRET